jgi:hypothetical protein
VQKLASLDEAETVFALSSSVVCLSVYHRRQFILLNPPMSAVVTGNNVKVKK